MYEAPEKTLINVLTVCDSNRTNVTLAAQFEKIERYKEQRNFNQSTFEINPAVLNKMQNSFFQVVFIISEADSFNFEGAESYIKQIRSMMPHSTIVLIADERMLVNPSPVNAAEPEAVENFVQKYACLFLKASTQTDFKNVIEQGLRTTYERAWEKILATSSAPEPEPEPASASASAAYSPWNFSPVGALWSLVAGSDTSQPPVVPEAPLNLKEKSARLRAFFAPRSTLTNEDAACCAMAAYQLGREKVLPGMNESVDFTDKAFSDMEEEARAFRDLVLAELYFMHSDHFPHRLKPAMRFLHDALTLCERLDCSPEFLDQLKNTMRQVGSLRQRVNNPEFAPALAEMKESYKKLFLRHHRQKEARDSTAGASAGEEGDGYVGIGTVLSVLTGPLSWLASGPVPVEESKGEGEVEPFAVQGGDFRGMLYERLKSMFGYNEEDGSLRFSRHRRVDMGVFDFWNDFINRGRIRFLQADGKAELCNTPECIKEIDALIQEFKQNEIYKQIEQVIEKARIFEVYEDLKEGVEKRKRSVDRSPAFQIASAKKLAELEKCKEEISALFEGSSAKHLWSSFLDLEQRLNQQIDKKIAALQDLEQRLNQQIDKKIAALQKNADYQRAYNKVIDAFMRMFFGDAGAKPNDEQKEQIKNFIAVCNQSVWCLLNESEFAFLLSQDPTKYPKVISFLETHVEKFFLLMSNSPPSSYEIPAEAGAGKHSEVCIQFTESGISARFVEHQYAKNIVSSIFACVGAVPSDALKDKAGTSVIRRESTALLQPDGTLQFQSMRYEGSDLFNRFMEALWTGKSEAEILGIFEKAAPELFQGPSLFSSLAGLVSFGFYGAPLSPAQSPPASVAEVEEEGHSPNSPCDPPGGPALPH
jgi:hypothetical protein